MSGAGSEALRTLGVIGGLWGSTRGGTAAVAAVQQARLADLVAHAERCSPFYRAHFRQVGRQARDARLAELPPTSEPQLMDRFDEVVTDPAVRRTGVEPFVADPDRVGELLHGRHSVYTTSATTGRPGVLVHDPGASAGTQRQAAPGRRPARDQPGGMPPLTPPAGAIGLVAGPSPVPETAPVAQHLSCR